MYYENIQLNINKVENGFIVSAVMGELETYRQATFIAKNETEVKSFVAKVVKMYFHGPADEKEE